MKALLTMLGIIFSCSMALLNCTSPGLNELSLEVGMARSDISGEEAEILDPLMVKAMVIRQGDEIFSIVACDIIKSQRELSRPVREQAAKATGIPYENICIAATHTHMGMPVKENLVPIIVETIVKAKENLEPVIMKSGTGKEFTVAFNRRYYMKDGSVRFNPMFLNPDIVRAVGPIDAEIGFAVFYDADDGTPTASVSNYSIHPDIAKLYGAVYQKEGEGSRNSVSADYPYFIEEMLREELGSEFNSLFVTGCCGNINHWDFSKPGPQSGYEKSRQVGEALAGAILDVLPESKEETPGLASRTRTIDVPIRPYSDEELKWAEDLRDQQLSNRSEEMSERQSFLDKIAMNRILWCHKMKQEGRTTMDIDVQVFRLSDKTAIVAFPGEMFVEHGLTVKNLSPFDNTIVMAYSNDAFSYWPNKLAFKQGGYEVENSYMAKGAGEMAVLTAVEMLMELN
ncbi:MAG: hypothetical protein ABFS38_16410 [Bacteroidota bacterium]